VEISKVTDTLALGFIPDKLHVSDAVELYMTRADNTLVTTAEELYLSASDIFTTGGYVTHQILVDYWLAVFYTYLFEECWGNDPSLEPANNIYFVKMQYYRNLKGQLKGQISAPMIKGVKPLSPEDSRRTRRAVRG
jgi:hypothetical protein